MDRKETTLDRLAPGAAGRIVRLGDPSPDTRRLMELGLIPGAVLTRRYTAPAGSLIAYEAGGTLLALRVKDAARITVRELGSPWIP